MKRAGHKLSEKLGREPTDQELADVLDIPRAKVAQLRTISIRPASLDAPIGDDDATEFSEIVGDESALTPFELLRDKTLRQEVRDILEELDEREAEILTMRFGLDGSKPVDARGSRQEIQGHPRTRPPDPEHRVDQAAPRHGQAGPPERSVAELNTPRGCRSFALHFTRSIS